MHQDAHVPGGRINKTCQLRHLGMPNNRDGPRYLVVGRYFPFSLDNNNNFVHILYCIKENL